VVADSLRNPALHILARLGGQPATPFYETGAARVVRETLDQAGIPFVVDQYGNIIARVPGQDPGVPPLALVAHLDHPGFESLSTHQGLLVAKARGGVPAGGFNAGVPVQAVLADGRRLSGIIEGRHGLESERQVLIKLLQREPVPLPCSIVFDLVDFTVDGEYVRMRAADDLAGCASILAALGQLSARHAPGDVYGVFTRAEEVGLVGAGLVAEQRRLPADTLVVSVESSRTLPGAEMGGGPVIRVGDAGSTFNGDAEAVLVRAREVLQSERPGFKAQRQLMSGGTCEASVFAVHGYKATGMAFPLGNYHNGGPEERIEAEYIHVQDFLGGVELMVAAARCVPDRGNVAVRRRLRQTPEEFRQRLLESVAGYGNV